MVKQQKIERKRQPKPATIIHEGEPKPLKIDPQYANAPVRAIYFVEVGGMDNRQVQMLLQELNAIYKSAAGGVHYVIPIRHGKITSDILFEKEFLDVVNKLCEATNGGEIVMKDGAKDVCVIREKV